MAKAMAEIFASSPQGPPVSMPTAPQPGAPSVPQTTGAAGVPVQTPRTSGLGLGVSPLGTPQPPQSPQAATPAPGGGTPLWDSPDAIMAQIKRDNPDMPPGVFSAIVNDHLMPLLDQQRQAGYKNFQEQLDILKLRNTEADKLNELYLAYAKLAETGANHQQMEAIKQAMVGIAAMSAQTTAALAQARIENYHSEIQDRADKAATGGPKVVAQRNELANAMEMTQDLIKKIDADPTIVGTPGLATRGVQTFQGWMSELGMADPPKTQNVQSVAQFRAELKRLQDLYNFSILPRSRSISGARADELNTIIPGMGSWDDPVTVRATLGDLYQYFSGIRSDLGDPNAVTPTPTPTPTPTTKTKSTAWPQNVPPLPADLPKQYLSSVDALFSAVSKGIITRAQAEAYAAQNPNLP